MSNTNAAATATTTTLQSVSTALETTDAKLNLWHGNRVGNRLYVKNDGWDIGYVDDDLKVVCRNKDSREWRQLLTSAGLEIASHSPFTIK